MIKKIELERHSGHSVNTDYVKVPTIPRFPTFLKRSKDLLTKRFHFIYRCLLLFQNILSSGSV